VLQADGTRLPFLDGSVDVVLEVHVLHLIPAWRAALAEVRRVLVPGGVVLIGRGGGRELSDGPLARIRRRFDELAEAAGGGLRRVGVADDAEKVAGLAAFGGTVDELEPVAWTEQETYAQALSHVEDRLYSYTWRLPDDVWRAATARLRAEVVAAHPDLDAPHLSRHRFALTRIRFD
jgi:SAM-dependent methyltransferase